MNYFKIAVYQNGLNPAELEGIFEAEATQRFKKGEETLGVLCQQDSWIFERRFEDASDINQVLGDFLGEHMKNCKGIAELSKKGEVCLTCAVYPEEEQAEIDISPENLGIIAKAGVGLHIEFMVL